MRQRIVTVTVLAFASVAAARPIAPAGLHDAIERIRIARKIPAVAILAAKGDTMLARDVWGTVASDSAEPAALDDAWHLGSCGKAMTATLAARLVEAGKIKWTTTLGEACPKLKGQIADKWLDVTLEEWCAQVSGMQSAEESIVFVLTLRGLEANQKLSPRDRRELLIAKLFTRPPVRPVGNFEYANLNYIIAGHMLEGVSGENWEDLMGRELFEPLAMKSAGFGAPPRIRGHDANGKSYAVDNSSVLGPAGTIHISLDDWLKFARLHAGLTSGFLKPESLEKLHSPVRSGYALGWFVVPQPGGGIVLTHDGTNTINYARIIIHPDTGVVLLIALNTSDDTACEEIAAAATAALLTEPSSTQPARQ